MNIKGKSRARGRELADHLLNAEQNETVKILAITGTVAQDLHGAFQEMEATATGTRCRKPLYHAKISPNPKDPAMTPEQWSRAITALSEQLGLTDHAYAAVLHRKYGKATPEILREHVHVVFCRIDPDTMLAMHDGHNYRKHELVARQLEREFGHARIQGAHVERNGQPRPTRTPPDWAMQQAAKSGIQPRDVAAIVKQLWNEAHSSRSFAAALEHEGLTLALGKRELVVLDAAGDVHTLARCLNLKVADIRERLAEIDRSKVPTVEQARAAIRERKAEKEPPAPVSDNDQATMRDEIQPAQMPVAAAATGQQERSWPIHPPPPEPQSPAHCEQPATARPAGAIDESAELTPPRPAPGSDEKKPGFGATLRYLFRQLAKRLTIPEPVQRRRKEETRGAFGRALQNIMRRIRRPEAPPPEPGSLWLADTMDWLQLWREEPITEPEACPEPTRPDGFDATADYSPGL